MKTILALVCAFAAAVSAVVMQDDPRPSLLIFCGPGPNGGPCPPCEEFHRDLYGADGRLLSTLQRDFSSLLKMDLNRHPEHFAKYSVDRWPTFIAVDQQGRELRRVVGYTGGRKMWEEITARQPAIATVSQSKPVAKPTVNPPSQVPPSPEPASKALKPSDITLSQQADCVDGVCLDPESRSTDAATRDGSSGNSAGTVTADPVAGTRDGGSQNTLGRVFRGLVQVAMDVGLTAAQSEVAVGLGAAAGPVGIGAMAVFTLLRHRKKKRPLTDAAGDPSSRQPATSAETQAKADDFRIESLPLQHIDYTTCWGEHWRNQHADPATALRELELYVQAWQAVKGGTLSLPGIDNPEAVFAAVSRWVNRQVTDHAQKALTSENTNHKVFFAHTWKDATNNIREGTWRTWKPNPPAADAIDDWVAARLTEKLTQSAS